MDLRTVVQNNLAGKGPDPAGAEELRYENGFPNLITGSADLVVKVTFAVAIDDVIFIVMSSLAIRLMIFKIFSAWMMKAPMAGIGMFFAFIGLHSGNGIDLIRDHPAVLVDLVEELVEIDNFMKKSFKEKELAEHHNFQKWLRELENSCKYNEKSQLCNFELVKKFVISLPFENGITKRRTWTMSLQRTLRMRT